MASKLFGKQICTGLILLLFVLSTLAVLPANASDSRVEENTRILIIKGTVYDGSTEKGIPNAVVYIWNDVNEFKTETDEHGNFIFEVPNAPYHIKAEAPGYHAVEQFIEKTELQEIQVKLVLKPVEPPREPMFVFGHVYDELYELPIAEAIIYFVGQPGEFKAVSGAEGGFEIKLPPAAYEVEAIKDGYHNAVLEVSGEPGSEVKLSVAMEPLGQNEPNWVFVEGTVFVAGTEKPIPKAYIVFHSKNYDVVELHTDENGHFAGEFPEGYYRVQAGAHGYKEIFKEIELFNINEYYLELFLEPASGDEEPEFGTVKGTVLNGHNEKPVAGAHVTIFHLSPDGEKRVAFESRTNDDGWFGFEEVPVGVYIINVNAEGFEPHESKIEVGLGIFEPNAEAKFDYREGKTTIVRIILKPLRDGDEPGRDRPRLSGRVFDAGSNEPIMAEVILKTESAMPEMKYMALGIRWGQIPGNQNITALAKWDGFVQVTKGMVLPVRTVLFDTGGSYDKGTDDHLYPQTNHMTVEWRSSTIPHWDGIILLVAVPVNAEPAPKLTIYTEKWEQTFKLRELADMHKTITVDDLGNKIEILSKMIDMPECDGECKHRHDRDPELKRDHPPGDERPPGDEPDLPPDEPPENPNTDIPRDSQTDQRTRFEGENDLRSTEEREESFNLRMTKKELIEMKDIIHKICMENGQGEPIVTKTNEKGFYAFMRLPSGHYDMIVIAPGHMEYYNEFTIRDDQHLKIDVYLRGAHKIDERDKKDLRFTVVKGKVTHIRSGEPIVKAKVAFEFIIPDKSDHQKPLNRGETDYPDKDGKERLNAEGIDIKEDIKIFATFTNERGFFEIKLPVGMYKMTVHARGFEEHISRIKVGVEPSEPLNIQLKPLNRDGLLAGSENAAGVRAGKDDSTEGASVKGLGAQVFEDSELASPMLALIIGLLLCAVMLPLFLLVRANRSSSRNKRKGDQKQKTPRKKRTLKNPKPGQPTKPEISKPTRNFQ